MMRSVQEIANELEQLSNEYALMFEGVERDGQIDAEEAQLGQEYADEYRKKLLALRAEIREHNRATSEQYRYQLYLFKSSAEGSKSELDVKYQAMQQEKLAALAPYKALLSPIEQALNEARLTRAAFAEVRDTLRANPQAFVEPKGLTTQELNLSMNDELRLLVNALVRLKQDWIGLQEEAQARQGQPDYLAHASHLRGIDKGLQRALDDLGAVIDLAHETIGEEE